MDASNFGVDAAGRPVVLDFRTIGWLPESLHLFTLLRSTHFAHEVAVHLFGSDEATRLREQPNLTTLGRVRTLLVQEAFPSFRTSNHSHILTHSYDYFYQIWIMMATRRQKS